MLRRAALCAFGAPASMACRARLCFFLHGRSTSFVLFPVVRAADSWRKRMRNAFEPSRFQVNGSCSTWIRVTIWSSCGHMLRAVAVQACRADAFRRADFACAFHPVFCCAPWLDIPAGRPVVLSGPMMGAHNTQPHCVRNRVPPIRFDAISQFAASVLYSDTSLIPQLLSASFCWLQIWFLLHCECGIV